MTPPPKTTESSPALRLLFAIGAGIAIFALLAFDWAGAPAYIVFFATQGTWLVLAAIGQPVRRGAWRFLSDALLVVASVALVLAIATGQQPHRH